MCGFVFLIYSYSYLHPLGGPSRPEIGNESEFSNEQVTSCDEEVPVPKKKKVSKEPSKRKGLAGLLIPIVLSIMVLCFLFIFNYNL